jgi:hypothetical protein
MSNDPAGAVHEPKRDPPRVSLCLEVVDDRQVWSSEDFDEYRLCVGPVVLGKSKLLFGDELGRLRMKLLQARALSRFVSDDTPPRASRRPGI